MRISILHNSALGIGAAAALLAGCGTSQQLPSATSATGAALFVFKHHMTFGYTGKEQTFKIPSGVTRIRVIAGGGNGAGTRIAHGGRVSSTIPVTPAETLAIFVGDNGTSPGGGFNGGGAGGASGSRASYGGYGGGGASDIREDGDGLKDRVVVAGGGAGQGGNDGNGPCGNSGGGGTRSGASGKPGCVKPDSGIGGGAGTGGTQQQGGTGGKSHGIAGTDGQALYGGAGGSGCSSASCGYFAGGGGGGGGGYYGGGGGGAGIMDLTVGFGGGGGGGGGSSFVERTGSDVQMCRGCNRDQSGAIVLEW